MLQDWRSRLSGASLARVIARGSLSSFLVSASGAAIGFASQVLLARHMGQSSYGTYVYVLGWMNAALLLAKAEIDTTSVRFVSTYRARGDGGSLRWYIRWAMQSTSALSALLALGTAIAIVALRDRIPAASFGTALAACALLPFLAAATVSGGCLLGLQQVARAQFPLGILRPAVVLAGASIVVLVAPAALEPQAVVLLGVAACGLALLLSTRWLREGIRAVPLTEAEPTKALWRKTAAGLLPASLAQLVLGQTSDVLVVGTMLSAREAGAYSVAGQFCILPGMIVTAIAAIAAPTIADYHARNDRPGLQHLLKVVGKANMLLGFPSVLLILVVANIALKWLGAGYAAAYPALVLLLLGGLFGTLGGHAALMLTMTGRQGAASVILGTTALGNLALSLLLTPRFGIAGTAAATAIATAVRSVLLAIWVRRDLGYSLWPW